MAVRDGRHHDAERKARRGGTDQDRAPRPAVAGTLPWVCSCRGPGPAAGRGTLPIQTVGAASVSSLRGPLSPGSCPHGACPHRPRGCATSPSEQAWGLTSREASGSRVHARVPTGVPPLPGPSCPVHRLAGAGASPQDRTMQPAKLAPSKPAAQRPGQASVHCGDTQAPPPQGKADPRGQARPTPPFSYLGVQAGRSLWPYHKDTQPHALGWAPARETLPAGTSGRAGRTSSLVRGGLRGQRGPAWHLLRASRPLSRPQRSWSKQQGHRCGRLWPQEPSPTGTLPSQTPLPAAQTHACALAH